MLSAAAAGARIIAANLGMLAHLRLRPGLRGRRLEAARCGARRRSRHGRRGFGSDRFASSRGGGAGGLGMLELQTTPERLGYAGRRADHGVQVDDA